MIKVFFPGEISKRLLAKMCFYQGTCLLFPRDCEGSEPDSRQMFSWEENGQKFWNISTVVLIVETPVWMGICMSQQKKKKQRFYVAASEFKGLEPYSALCNHAYKNKICSHSKSSRRVFLRV